MATNEQVDIPEEDLVTDDFGDEGSDDAAYWKAQAEKWHGTAKRRGTQLGKLKDRLSFVEDAPPDKKSTSQNKSDGTDWGKRAYLLGRGIDHPEDIALFERYETDTGKSIDEILNHKTFQADLTDLRDKRIAEAATPSASRRSNAPSRDMVEFWLAKGELPPADQVQLRRDVLNERIKREKNNSMFSSNPIIMSN